MAKKMKHVLLMALSLVLVAALAISGTVAYLTSEDSDVNVMTLGNVKIEQLEYERVPANGVTRDATSNSGYELITTPRGEGYKLQKFTQNKPLYPSQNQADAKWDATKVNLDQLKTGRGAMDVFDNPLAVDKFVFVQNTGKSPAYVRTLIAFEIGSVAPENFDSLIMTSKHFTWGTETVGVIEVGNNKYLVVEYVYNGHETHHAGGVLPAGEITYNSLAQAYMTADTTNEDVEALDGNKNGTYDILVLSQAVQVEGFGDAQTALDTAFGDTTVEKATEWFGGVAPIVVSTSDELVAAFKNGGTIILEKDIVLEEILVIPADVDVVFNMNGKTLTPANEKVDPLFDSKTGSSLVIEGNGTVDLGEYKYTSFLRPRGDVTIKNGTFLRAAGDDIKEYGAFFVGIKGGKGKLIIEDGYFDGGYYKEGDCFNNCRSLLNCSWGQYIRVYGGTFVGQNPAWGDEGMADICPHCTSTYCQGIFLEGQTKASTELPDGYTITEGTTADGRPTYTVVYNK